MQILLIGCGRMGGALAATWLENDYNLTAIDPIKPKLSAPWFKNVADIDKQQFDAIIIAVKPQHVEGAINDSSHLLKRDGFYLSIAAGKTLTTMTDAANNKPVIRAMPNTPCAIGKGITALFGNDQVSRAHCVMAEQLMQAGGKVLWLDDEQQFDAVTALSGSGPAYVFHFAEALTQAGIALGLSEKMALQLAKSTLHGSTQLMMQSHENLTTLRENVTSPNGTTAAGLSVLMTDLTKLMEQTLKAAAARSKELSEIS